jgi:hypothetical protein
MAVNDEQAPENPLDRLERQESAMQRLRERQAERKKAAAEAAKLEAEFGESAPPRPVFPSPPVQQSTASRMPSLPAAQQAPASIPTLWAMNNRPDRSESQAQQSQSSAVSHPISQGGSEQLLKDLVEATKETNKLLGQLLQKLPSPATAG